MKFAHAILTYLSTAFGLESGCSNGCKCTPDSDCWPVETAWASLNYTLRGALVRGVAPGSVCYLNQFNYDPEACAFVASQWFNSTWHASDPVSVDYPIWTNNSCNPIWPNGTSVTGDVDAGAKGCSMGAYPAYVVNTTSPEQISTALKWAREKNIRVIVKSTGHSYAGRSIGYGSLSIWTHNLRGIEFIEDFKPASCPYNGTLKAARVAAGHTGMEVQLEMEKHNLVAITGANPDVGLVGWLTGGGHGFLTQTYGMGADNLLEATIVTPDGAALMANPCNNADLFFAIRGGGGGTYGVVTEVVVKVYGTPKTTSHTFKVMSLGPDKAIKFYDFLGFIHSEMQGLKDGGMQGYYYVVGPPTVPTLSFAWTFMLFDAPNGTVERLMKPIENYLDERKELFAYSQDIKHADTYLEIFSGKDDNELVATGGSAYGSRLMSPESLEYASITAKVLAQIGPSNDSSQPNAPYTNPILIGHMIASPNSPTYFPTTISMNPTWRNTLVHLIVVSSFPDGSPQFLIDAVYRDITYNKTAALRELSPNTGAYFNEADSNEVDWQKSFFGDSYSELRRLKEKYDPGNVLWCRRCVGSENLVETADGRLCKAKDGGERQEL